MAGVSQPAVSTFLDDPHTTTLSRDKKDLIFEYIRKNNFELPSKRTSSIGFIVPEHFHGSNDSFSEFYHRFYNGVISSCNKYGSKIIIYNDVSDLKTFLNHSLLEVRGLRVLEKFDIEQVQKIMQYQPVVLMNQETRSLICDTVMPDNKGAIDLVVSSLLKKGHRNIGFFGLVGAGKEYCQNLHFYKRVDGFYESIRKNNLRLKGEWVKIFEAVEQTYEEMDAFAAEALASWTSKGDLPTAVVTSNDNYAVRLMRAAQKIGYKIPRDLSVTGFDDKAICDLVSPRLTSVAYNFEEIADASVELLQKRLQGDSSNPRKIICSLDIIERESIGEPKRTNVQ